MRVGARYNLPVIGVTQGSSGVVQLPGVGDVPQHEALRLLALARQVASPLTTWTADMDWTRASNAHRTNKFHEMERALRSDHNWFEGDVRISRDGRLEMAHDVHDRGAGLTFDEWLMIGIASGRGLKVELKEPAGFDMWLDAIERHGVDPTRLILNVPVAPAPGEYGLSDAQLRTLRRRFPDATINLSPTGHQRYTAAVIGELARTARLVGGRVMFPMQWDLLSDDMIAALRPYGRVAVWSAQWWGTPEDPITETETLRARGVDGMVDLATAGTGARLAAAAARGLGDIFGRQSVVQARDAFVTLRERLRGRH